MDENLFSGYSLVVGSSLSGFDFGSDQLSAAIRRHFKVNEEEKFSNLFFLIDHLTKKETNEIEIKDFIKSHFSASPIDPVLSKIAARPWKSIISLSFDEKLIEELNLEINRRVTARRLSVISSNNTNPVNGSIPFYELLGSISDIRAPHALSITQGQYLKRRREWRNILKSFPDYNKASSLVFMGTNRDVEIVTDLINELLSLSPGLPSKLIFFKGDPCAHDTSLKSLLPSHVQIHELEITLRKWLDSVDVSHRQLSLPLGSMEGIDYEKLGSIGERLHIVPRENDLGSYDPSSHNRMIDYLFKPSELNWEPYRQKLDFPRCITNLIMEKIEDSLSSDNSGILFLTGEAGVGKTIVMRRLAYDCADKGYLSLWIKRSIGYQEFFSWSSIVRKINESISKVTGTKVVLFLDGALNRFDHIDELIQALESESLKWCLVTCRRKTEEAFGNEELGVNNYPELNGSSIVFPNELSQREIADLPGYLISIKAAADIQAAAHLVKEVEKRNASDVLCALWYLLPQTRSAIAGSLSEEYFTLGGIEGVVQNFARESASKRDWARRAYELVTTCSGLDIPLPIEVLIRSLQIEYQDWINVCVNGEPLWGLLYDENYNNGESYAYRTRNEVVTNVLLKTLNGTSASHIGEFRCLKDILLSCEIGSPIYRNTAATILIGKKKELKKRFTFEQGLELFDAAIAALPFEDRSLVHHRGLWIKDAGGNYVGAYEAISKALKTDDYPLSEKGESLGHVHTSLASCIVREVENLDLDHDVYASKLHAIEDHLVKAEKYSPYDPYNSHVSANLFIKVATKFKNKDEDLYLASIANAIRIISSSLTLADASKSSKSRSSQESLQMLKNLEERLFQISDNFEENDNLAKAAFNASRDQTGFYVILKVLIAEAAAKNKGKMFKRAEDYLSEVVRLIYSNSCELDSRIIECRVDLAVKWHILSGISNAPNWSHLEEDLLTLLDSPVWGNQILNEFYRAITLFHLQRINEAEAIFNQLRRRELPGDLRRTRRCLYIDKNGNAKMFQGQIKDGNLKKYVYCSEFSSEFLCSNEFFEKNDSLVHFYLAFTIQGPVAIKTISHS